MNYGILYFFILFFSLCGCRSAKLSEAEEKQRIGEYYEAAAIYRKVYTKTSPQKRDLRGYIAFRMAECNRLINNTGSTSAHEAIRDYPKHVICFCTDAHAGALRGTELRYTERTPAAIEGYRGELVPMAKEPPLRGAAQEKSIPRAS